MKIESMTIADLSYILDNLYTDFDDFWNYNVFKQEFENPNSKYIIAKIENQIVGFGGIWKSVDDVHITNIVTSKNSRNLGIASKLLEKLIIMAKKEEVNSITLEVNENNIPAVNLYTKYNFAKVGIRKKYYDNEENAIIMTLSINN